MSAVDGRRWRQPGGEHSKGHFAPSDPAVEAFLDGYAELCRKHGMQLEHEDTHGAFEIVDCAQGDTFDWVRAAHDNRKVSP